MTIVTAENTWTWSPEVQALARKKGVEAYLDPLLEATLGLFPDAKEVRVYAWRDPEILDLEAICFEVDSRIINLEERVAWETRWYRAFDAICPKPHILTFIQLLNLAGP